MDMYIITQKYLDTTKTEFHSFALPREHLHKVVIKGLLLEMSSSEVAEELKSLGYEPKHVRQFGSPLKKMPIPMITLASNPSNKEIFNLHSLFYMMVKVESYRSDNPTQCFSC